MSATASLQPLPHVLAMGPCQHGGVSAAELRELGLLKRDVLDFSVSINPLGPSPAALEALASLGPADIAGYPDESVAALSQALATRLGVPAKWIILGNGSVELLWLLALAYLSHGARVLVIGPTFGEYARAAAVMGAEVVEYRANPSRCFQPDLNAIVETTRRERPRLIFLCNPNNPTGVMLEREAVLHLLDVAPDALLIVDEAYRGFADAMPDLADQLGAGHLLLLRSMTKDYGLAGLRLGYALAPESVIETLHALRPPWPLNAPALTAGLAALGDDLHVQRARAEVIAARHYLGDALTRFGLEAVTSSTNFLLVRVGDGAAFRRCLLERGICVRDCASFGLPEYIRIGVRTRPECAILVAAIDAVRHDARVHAGESSPWLSHSRGCT